MHPLHHGTFLLLAWGLTAAAAAAEASTTKAASSALRPSSPMP